MTCRGFSTDPNIEVSATAAYAYDARDKILAYKPDVMTYDVVILTRMGYDGAKGLLAMHRVESKTIGRDISSCVVYGM